MRTEHGGDFDSRAQDSQGPDPPGSGLCHFVAGRAHHGLAFSSDAGRLADGPYDYYRFSPVVRAFWDRPDRFMRYVAGCYPRFPAQVFPMRPPTGEVGSWSRATVKAAAVSPSAILPVWTIRYPPNAGRAWCAIMRSSTAIMICATASVRSIRATWPAVRGHFRPDYVPKIYRRFAALSPAARPSCRAERLNAMAGALLVLFGIRMIAQQRAPLHHASRTIQPTTPRWNSIKS